MGRGLTFAATVSLCVVAASCDPAPHEPVRPPALPAKPATRWELSGKVAWTKSGEVQDFTWTVKEGEAPGASHKDAPSDFKAAVEVCEISISRTDLTSVADPGGNPVSRTTSMVYRVSGDGKRFVVIKGGIPYHALEAVDAEKAVIEALQFCKDEAASILYGKGATR